MPWQVILAFAVTLPVVLLSLLLIWCLNIRVNVVAAKETKTQQAPNSENQPHSANNIR